MRIEVGGGTLEASVRGDRVTIRLAPPRDIRWNFCMTILNCPYTVSFVNTGVPHVVHFTEELNKLDVKMLGSKFRYHKEFSPQGANVDFVQVVDRHKIKVRTYERGVEDETLACGTGAVASAIIAAESEKLDSPITVQMLSGEELKVYFSRKSGQFKDIFLEGRPRLVYEGEFNI